MSIQELKDLSMEEKLMAMETLWEDLRGNFDRASASKEMKELLLLRRERVRTGKVATRDWDEVRNFVGRP